MDAVLFKDFSAEFNGHKILESCSLEIPEKKITVVVGRSGCGKTTLLRSINRLNDEFPGFSCKGSLQIRIGGKECSVYPEDGLDSQELRKRAGMVFQTPQVFPMDIRRNLQIVLSAVSHCPKGEYAKRMEHVLRQVDLWDEVNDRMDLPANRLSGGQQQRLCLARALLLEPEILLLDEPTASLDVRASAHIENLLKKLCENITLVVVSHNPMQALRLADVLVVMQSGRVRSIHAGSDMPCVEQLERFLNE